MHGTPLRRTKHFSKHRSNFDIDASNNFGRRGLLGLPVLFPSIPVVNPLIVGVSTPTPTPGINIPNVTPPLPPIRRQPTPAPSPDPGDGKDPSNGPHVTAPSIPVVYHLGRSKPTHTPGNNAPDVPANHGGGGGKTPTTTDSGSGNTSVPDPNNTPDGPPKHGNGGGKPSTTQDSGGGNTHIPNPAKDGGGDGGTPTTTEARSGDTGTPNPGQNSPPNSPTPTPELDSNPDSSGSEPSNLSDSTPSSGSPSSQSSGASKNGVVRLPGSDPQSSGGSDDQESVVITTISGVRTELTRRPYPTNGGGGDGPTGGPGGGSVDGSGNEANPPGSGRLGHGIIAAIVIGAVLALALLVFFLRKRVRKRRAAWNTRWLSGGGNGGRTSFRSSFGDLRASTFGSNSVHDHDNPDEDRFSGPFSDNMTVSSLSLVSAHPPIPQMLQVAHTEITPPAIAVLSTGKRSSRSSLFSVGSSESGGSDESGIQWAEVRSDAGCDDNGRLNPNDELCFPSHISVRPFTPTESWSFPQPPTFRTQSTVYSRGLKELVDSNPFADPVPQPSASPVGLSEIVTKGFEPRDD